MAKSNETVLKGVKYNPLKHYIKISHDNYKTWSNLPLIGFGTFQLKHEQCEKPVEYALNCGYRHIDTAQVYFNEWNIGKIIHSFTTTTTNSQHTISSSSSSSSSTTTTTTNSNSNNNNTNHKEEKEKEKEKEKQEKKENKIFITSKLAPKNMKQSDTVIKETIYTTIKNLRQSSQDQQEIDLFLIHWPAIPRKSLTDSIHSQYRIKCWKILEEFKEKGYIKNIGVSNYEIRHIQEIQHMVTQEHKCRYLPCVNQIEFHPLYTRWDIVNYCRQNNIQIISYASLGGYESTLLSSSNTTNTTIPYTTLNTNINDIEKTTTTKNDTIVEWTSNNTNKNKHPLLDHETIQKIAQYYQKSAAQILLRWCIQHQIPVIPKSTHKKRIEENIDIFDFEISSDHMQEINAIGEQNKPIKFAWDPFKIA